MRLHRKKIKLGLLGVVTLVFLIQVFFRDDNELNDDDLQETMVETDYKFSSEPFFKFLQEANYFKSLTTKKSFEKDLCKIPRLDIWAFNIKELLYEVPVYANCQKNSPLSYIKKNRLYIDNEVNKKYYDNSIVGCEFAPVIRSTYNNDNYKLGT